MTATLFKVNSNSGERWVLQWRWKGMPYFSSAPTKKDAMDYAKAMSFSVEEVENGLLRR